jgi:LPPG:FO 2-phospho-L-lactate transferase
VTRVVILAGGTGGAKLAAGLATVVPAGDLTVIANTGDDVERHGLLVMPDHDAILYMLGDRFDHDRGWGIVDETWAVMDGLKAYGEESWFGLGDRDFATHIARTARIRAGATITEAVLALQTAVGLRTRILPMTDAAVRTQVLTDDGWLDFQEYFVHRHQAPDVRGVRFEGIETAGPTDAVLAALAATDLIVIGPSNPIVSLGPILAVPGMAAAIGDARRRGIPVMTVSGIVGGKALKGPADRMLVSLGHESSARGVAELLAPHTDLFVVDTVDADSVPAIGALGVRTHVTDTIMADAAGRARLAGDVLAAAQHSVAS